MLAHGGILCELQGHHPITQCVLGSCGPLRQLGHLRQQFKVIRSIVEQHLPGRPRTLKVTRGQVQPHFHGQRLRVVRTLGTPALHEQLGQIITMTADGGPHRGLQQNSVCFVQLKQVLTEQLHRTLAALSGQQAIESLLKKGHTRVWGGCGRHQLQVQISG